MLTFQGGCHCGGVGFTFRTSREPERWQVRACQCRFCRTHGALSVSDPNGSVSFEIPSERKVRHYRFGTRTTDFLICAECGVYIGAVTESSRGRIAVININAVRPLLAVPAPIPMSYEGEAVGERLARRTRNWTPVTER